MTWLAQCREWMRKYDPVRPEHLAGGLHHYGFMRVLSEKLPANAIIVSDTGGNVIMMGHAFRSKEGQRIFTSNGNTPMGFAMCGAIGAAFAQPPSDLRDPKPMRPIICIIGDGGFQLNSQELQTIEHYNLPIKIIVINNGILGNTKSYQRVNGKAELACGPDGYSAPDFVAVAQAYGIDAHRFEAHDDIGDLLRFPRALLIDVPHYDYCTYEPRMSRWDSAINEMYPPLPEAEFLENCINPPLEGWEKRR